jgi:hypothetical protein
LVDASSIFIVGVVLACAFTVFYYRRKYHNIKRRYENLVNPPKPAPSPKSKLELDREQYLKLRSQILLRDGFRCQECGYYKHLEVHHIVPRSKGGTDDLKNLITLCQRCHGKKHGFKNRENRRAKHARRNHRKKENHWLNKHKHEFLKEPFIEDFHPHSKEVSPERRRQLYEKWKRNELNPT